MLRVKSVKTTNRRTQRNVLFLTDKGGWEENAGGGGLAWTRKIVKKPWDMKQTKTTLFIKINYWQNENYQVFGKQTDYEHFKTGSNFTKQLFVILQCKNRIFWDKGFFYMFFYNFECISTATDNNKTTNQISFRNSLYEIKRNSFAHLGFCCCLSQTFPFRSGATKEVLRDHQRTRMVLNHQHHRNEISG